MNTNYVSRSCNSKQPINNGYPIAAGKENTFFLKTQPMKSISSSPSILPSKKALNPNTSVPKPLEKREVNIPQQQSGNLGNSPVKMSKGTSLRNLEDSPQAPKRKAVDQSAGVPQPVKKFHVDQELDDQIRRENLQFLESLQPHPTIKNLFCDKSTGCQYIARKIEENEYRENVLLNKIYSCLGANILQHKLLTLPKGSNVLLVKLVDGIKPSEYLKNASPEQTTHLFNEVSKHFAADVLLKNTPVLNGNLDEAYIIDEKGVIWRTLISSLKPFHNDVAYPIEIWESRNPSKNKNSAIWSSLDILKIANQILTIVQQNDVVFYGLNREERDIALKRFTNILIIANKTISMSDDGWHLPYIDTINMHMTALKLAGCERGLPEWLHPDLNKKDKPCQLRGPSGRRFEGLRGRDSVVETILMPYVRNNNGNYQFIIDWMKGHENSGWSEMAQILMYFLSLHRKAPPAGHFWMQGPLMPKVLYEDCAKKEGQGNRPTGEKIIYNSFSILHAFTQIVLGRIDFPNNTIRSSKEGSVRILRTENKLVMNDYGHVGNKNINMPVAVYSSGSPFEAPIIHGTELTERKVVPHHRIIATYFMQRSRSEPNRGAFSNDFQNEFTAILGGINCDYIGSLKK